MPDVFEDPEVQAWARSVREDLVPKLRVSAATVAIVPQGDSDVKFAVELGLSIMLGKPIILAAARGQKIPDKLVAVADEIVEVDWTGLTVRDQERLTAAIQRVIGDA